MGTLNNPDGFTAGCYSRRSITRVGRQHQTSPAHRNNLVLFKNAIDELLKCSRRRLVLLVNAFQKQKMIPEFLTERFGAVAYHIQTAAFMGTFKTKRRQDKGPSGFERTSKDLNIFLSFIRFCQKMKHSAVMPQVKTILREIDLKNISFNPGNLFGSFAKPLL